MAKKKAEQTAKKAEGKKQQTAERKPEQKKRRRKVLFAVLKDGRRLEVLRQDGMYLYCENTAIAHNSPRLAYVEEGEKEA